MVVAGLAIAAINIQAEEPPGQTSTASHSLNTVDVLFVLCAMGAQINYNF